MNYAAVVAMLRECGFAEPRPSGSWWRNESARLAAELIYDDVTDVYRIHVEPAL